MRHRRQPSRCRVSNMASSDLRKLFLQQFMQEVLWHVAQRVPINTEDNKQEISLLTKHSEAGDSATTASETPEKDVLQKNNFAAYSHTQSGNKQAVTQQSRSSPLLSRGAASSLPYRVPTLLLRQRTPSPKVYLAPPTESWLVNLQSLSHIQPLLADPTITTIECPGPGMPLMIARGTYVQSTPAHFTTEEIKKIIEEISERTKIPLGASGIFKAAVGNIIITAVLSEFVGTRFIIQKKPKASASSLPPAPLRR